jgi:hypothetical protein
LQPRRRFAEAELEALAQSIREKGILQPLLVRPVGNGEGAFELVAGERRWRAAQRVGVHEVPVIVRALADCEALEIAIVENLQREDLAPLEEAEAYKRLVSEFGRTQAGLAEAVGKSRSHIANTWCSAGPSNRQNRDARRATPTLWHWNATSGPGSGCASRLKPNPAAGHLPYIINTSINSTGSSDCCARDKMAA